MRGTYQMKSGITVSCRKFERRDAVPCSNLLKASFGWEGKIPEGAHDLYGKQMMALMPANVGKAGVKHGYWIAEVGGQLAGLAGVRPFPAAKWVTDSAQLFHQPAEYVEQHRPPAAEVFELAVAGDLWRKGIGTLLLTLAIVANKSITHFHAYAPPSVVPLFTSCGFSAGQTLGSVRWGSAVSLYAKLVNTKDILGKLETKIAKAEV
jgi:GNAT superfamily N-acetyltransferase